MPTKPKNITARPAAPDMPVDVIGEVIEAVHLRTVIFGKIDFGAPWRLRIPEREYLSFYVVARGSAWLELQGVRPRSRTPAEIALSTGDAVILPLGSAHELRDVVRSDVAPLSFDFDACPREPHAARAGGDGPVTSIIIGHFALGSAPRNALLASLPAAIHLPAGAVSASPQLAGLVPLILSESGSPGAGSSIVLARLADLLFVHALRFWSSTVDASACGLGAVADPAFTELVGEPPLQYLAHWRMTMAAQRLREDHAVIADVAQAVGYANPVAFSKAFARTQGVGPGTFRRREQLARRAPR